MTIGIGRVPQSEHHFSCKICRQPSVGSSRSARYCQREDCAKIRQERKTQKRAANR